MAINIITKLLLKHTLNVVRKLLLGCEHQNPKVESMGLEGDYKEFYAKLKKREELGL